MIITKIKNLFKNIPKALTPWLIFVVMMAVGIAVVIAFIEPDSGTDDFVEPPASLGKGDWFAYGRGWEPNASGDGSTALTKAACEAADKWYWFEDGNGDSDQIDEEDGICVQASSTNSGILTWNGSDYETGYDNSYIAAYTCSGSFPNGTVFTYSGLDISGDPDEEWNNGDCALCQADCYDGKKDLPGQNGYTTQGAYTGPITPEILKNWKGTRLPTHNDFFGFCGHKDESNPADDYETGCSSDTTYGTNGQMIGRTDECLDLSNTSWEWLSEQHYYNYARIAGGYACSYFNSTTVYYPYRFRAVFRP